MQWGMGVKMIIQISPQPVDEIEEIEQKLKEWHDGYNRIF